MQDWDEANEWERSWWGTCQNTYFEEQKQLDYAPKMGLEVQSDSQGPFIDAENKKILDVGGGPVSLLLKCINLRYGMVIDPCNYPEWVFERYSWANIIWVKSKAEDMYTEAVGFGLKDIFDEVWSYNLLQHVEDPAKIVANMRRCSKIIRVFDWLEISGPGHPQYLTEEKMNEWFGGIGKVRMGNGGKEYSGIFLGEHYVKS